MAVPRAQIQASNGSICTLQTYANPNTSYFALSNSNGNGNSNYPTNPNFNIVTLNQGIYNDSAVPNSNTSVYFSSGYLRFAAPNGNQFLTIGQTSDMYISSVYANQIAVSTLLSNVNVNGSINVNGTITSNATNSSVIGPLTITLSGNGILGNFTGPYNGNCLCVCTIKLTQPVVAPSTDGLFVTIFNHANSLESSVSLLSGIINTNASLPVATYQVTLMYPNMRTTTQYDFSVASATNQITFNTTTSTTTLSMTKLS